MSVTAQKLADEIVNGQLLNNWIFWALFFGAIALRFCLDSAFGPYAKAKVELRSLKKDFAEFKNRLAETTELTKSIETKIAHSDWALRENKILRRAKLEELVSNIFAVEKWATDNVSHSIFKTTDFATECPIEHLRMLTGLYFTELEEDMRLFHGLNVVVSSLALAARSAVAEARRNAEFFRSSPGEAQRDAVTKLRKVIEDQSQLLLPYQENIIKQSRELAKKAYALMPGLIEA